MARDNYRNRIAPVRRPYRAYRFRRADLRRDLRVASRPAVLNRQSRAPNAFLKFVPFHVEWQMECAQLAREKIAMLTDGFVHQRVRGLTALVPAPELDRADAGGSNLDGQPEIAMNLKVTPLVHIASVADCVFLIHLAFYACYQKRTNCYNLGV